MPTDTFFALKEEKRQRIYDAALDEFNSAAYEDVTIQAIINRAGIPRGSFYQYFTDKDDLAVYCMVEGIRKSIDATCKDNMNFLLNNIYFDFSTDITETDWYQSALIRQQKILTERETIFQNKTAPLFPLRLLRSSFCEYASLYYPYFCRSLDKEDIVDSKYRKVLAFYLSLADFLYQEYAYMNHWDITDRMVKEKAIAAVSLPLRIILDALRPCSRPFSEDSRLFPDRFQDLHLTSIRLLSPAGSDLTIPVSAGGVWQMQGKILSVPIECEKISGSLQIKIDSHTADFAFLPSGCLSFRVEEKGKQLFAAECFIPLKDSVYTLPVREFTGIGIRQDGKKVCLLEQGEFFL